MADLMKLSESGFKKVINSNDINISRLNQICDILELSLNEIIQIVEDNRLRETKFSIEHERFFVRNKNFFYFYWLLVVERKSITKIKTKYAITDQQINTYLTKLDSMNLIELHPNNKIKLPPRRASKWVGSGPLTEEIQSDWGAKLWKDSIEEQEGLSSVRYLKLDSDSKKELRARLEELESEFVARSIRLQNSMDDLATDMRFMFALNQKSFVTKL